MDGAGCCSTREDPRVQLGHRVLKKAIIKISRTKHLTLFSNDPLFYKSRCSLILSSSSSKCIINHSAVTMASGVLNLTLEQYIFIILIELDFFYIQHSLTHMHHKLPILILLTIAVVTITISLFHCNCIPETLKRKMDRRRKIYSESRSFTNTCSFCRWTVTYTSQEAMYQNHI